MALKLLDSSVRSRLRSGVAVTSMVQCVEELVENSVDAGATCIAVRVDVSRYKIQIVDNGKGISSDDLKLVGERYATSKCHTLADLENLQYFGFRGEALASIINISGTVEICSRHKLSHQTYSKLFHNGKPVSSGISMNTRPSVGTTVTVHDFFYNLPVRRKGISQALELDRVRKAVECLALVNPLISISVKSDKTGELLLQTHKTSSILTNFGQLFGNDKASNMKAVSTTHCGFSVSGFMSTEGHHNKSMQFVYVNGRIVKKTQLHTCINNLLANSMIARKLSRQNDPNWQSKELSQERDFQSPRRTPDRYGMYVLMISCPRTEYDICLEPGKTLIEFKEWNDVLGAMESVVKKHLVDNSLTLGPVLCDRNSSEKDSYNSTTEQSNSTDVGPTSVTAPSQQTCKFLGEERFDLEFRKVVQSRTVRLPKKQCSSSGDVRGGISQGSLPPSQTEELHMEGDSERHLCSTAGSGDSYCGKDAVEECHSLGILASLPPSLTDELASHSRITECQNPFMLHAHSGTTGPSLQPDPFLSYAPNRRLRTHPVKTTMRESLQDDTSLNPSMGQPRSHSMLPNADLYSLQAYSQGTTIAAPSPTTFFVTPFHASGSTTVPISTPLTASLQPRAQVTSSTSQPRHVAKQPQLSRSLVSLSTSLRSPLQSGNVSSKLAKLFERGRSAQKHSFGKLSQPANIQSSTMRATPGDPKNTSFPETLTMIGNPLHESTPTFIATVTSMNPVSYNSLQSSHMLQLTSSNPYHSVTTRESDTISSREPSYGYTMALGGNMPTTASCAPVSSNNTPQGTQYEICSSDYGSSMFYPSHSSVGTYTSSTLPSDLHSEGSYSLGSLGTLLSQQPPSCGPCLQTNTCTHSSFDGMRDSALSISNCCTSVPQEMFHQGSSVQTRTALTECPTQPSMQPHAQQRTHIQPREVHITKGLPQRASCHGLQEPQDLHLDLQESGFHELSSEAALTQMSSTTLSSIPDQSNESIKPQDAQSGDSGFLSYELNPNSITSRETPHSENTKHSDMKQKQLWKEAIDPASGRKIYIHSFTGTCSTEKPPGLGPQEDSSCSFGGYDHQSSLAGHSLSRLSGSMWSKDRSRGNSSSLGVAPLRAAPHLSHDFSPLMPKPKHQRIRCTSLNDRAAGDSTDVTGSSDTSLLSLLTEHRASCLNKTVAELNSKWRSSNELQQLSLSSADESCSIAKLLENWENPTFRAGHEDILSVGYSGVRRGQIKVHNAVQHYKFSKEMFKSLKVLGQVDDKFIACLMDSKAIGCHNLLVVIDQHAAHERVRLEDLTSGLYEDTPPLPTAGASPVHQPPSRIRSSVVQPPLVISLQPSERRLARLFRTQLEAIGVSLIFRCDVISVTSIPSVFMEREASELRRGRPTVALDIVKELIVKQLELLQATCGRSSTIPSTITHVLNSQACHGAIKFGDPLTLVECQSLIQQLSQCKLPFQCAHGRPSVMPILDLNVLNRRYPAAAQEVTFPHLKKLKMT